MSRTASVREPSPTPPALISTANAYGEGGFIVDGGVHSGSGDGFAGSPYGYDAHQQQQHHHHYNYPSPGTEGSGSAANTPSAVDGGGGQTYGRRLSSVERRASGSVTMLRVPALHKAASITWPENKRVMTASASAPSPTLTPPHQRRASTSATRPPPGGSSSSAPPGRRPSASVTVKGRSASIVSIGAAQHNNTSQHQQHQKQPFDLAPPSDAAQLAALNVEEYEQARTGFAALPAPTDPKAEKVLRTRGIQNYARMHSNIERMQSEMQAFLEEQMRRAIEADPRIRSKQMKFKDKNGKPRAPTAEEERDLDRQQELLDELISNIYGVRQSSARFMRLFLSEEEKRHVGAKTHESFGKDSGDKDRAPPRRYNPYRHHVTTMMEQEAYEQSRKNSMAASYGASANRSRGGRNNSASASVFGHSGGSSPHPRGGGVGADFYNHDFYPFGNDPSRRGTATAGTGNRRNTLIDFDSYGGPGASQDGSSGAGGGGGSNLMSAGNHTLNSPNGIHLGHGDGSAGGQRGSGPNPYDDDLYVSDEETEELDANGNGRGASTPLQVPLLVGLTSEGTTGAGAGDAFGGGGEGEEEEDPERAERRRQKEQLRAEKEARKRERDAIRARREAERAAKARAHDEEEEELAAVALMLADERDAQQRAEDEAYEEEARRRRANAAETEEERARREAEERARRREAADDADDAERRFRRAEAKERARIEDEAAVEGDRIRRAAEAEARRLRLDSEEEAAMALAMASAAERARLRAERERDRRNKEALEDLEIAESIARRRIAASEAEAAASIIAARADAANALRQAAIGRGGAGAGNNDLRMRSSTDVGTDARGYGTGNGRNGGRWGDGSDDSDGSGDSDGFGGGAGGGRRGPAVPIVGPSTVRPPSLAPQRRALGKTKTTYGICARSDGTVAGIDLAAYGASSEFADGYREDDDDAEEGDRPPLHTDPLVVAAVIKQMFGEDILAPSAGTHTPVRSRRVGASGSPAPQSFGAESGAAAAPSLGLSTRKYRHPKSAAPSPRSRSRGSAPNSMLNSRTTTPRRQSTSHNPYASNSMSASASASMAMPAVVGGGGGGGRTPRRALDESFAAAESAAPSAVSILKPSARVEASEAPSAASFSRHPSNAANNNNNNNSATMMNRLPLGPSAAHSGGGDAASEDRESQLLTARRANGGASAGPPPNRVAPPSPTAESAPSSAPPPRSRPPPIPLQQQQQRELKASALGAPVATSASASRPIAAPRQPSSHGGGGYASATSQGSGGGQAPSRRNLSASNASRRSSASIVDEYLASQEAERRGHWGGAPVSPTHPAMRSSGTVAGSSGGLPFAASASHGSAAGGGDHVGAGGGIYAPEASDSAARPTARRLVGDGSVGSRPSTPGRTRVLKKVQRRSVQ